MGNSGGVSASRGFDYQDKVAAFLLLWANTHEDFESLEIESSFGDDIFINLTSSQPNTQAVIRVSVKTKAANYQWEASEIRDMLLKTNEDRGVGNTQPNLLAQIVADINQKLLFITDGSANIKLSGLRAKDIENPFERLSIPQSDHDSFAQIRQSVSKEKQDAVDLFLQAKTTLVFQRIFMCTGMTGRDIEARAFVLLNKHYRVPYSQHDPCWKSLVEKAKNARYSSNSKDRIFSRLNIQRLVAPLAVSAPYPDVADYFFATRDYSECLQRLTNEHVLVLIGEPAVGKKTIARILANRFAEMSYVPKEAFGQDVHLKIYQFSRDVDNVIVIAKNPFGSDKFDPQLALAFASQLHEIFESVAGRNGKTKLVVTTRKHIWLEVCTEVKLSSFIMKRVSFEIQNPIAENWKNILNTHLRRNLLSVQDIDQIAKHLRDGRFFENPLHIREFAAAVKTMHTADGYIGQAFEESRPSLYHRWAKIQNEPTKVILFAARLLIAEFSDTQLAGLKSIIPIVDEFVFGLNTSVNHKRELQESLDTLQVTHRLMQIGNRLQLVHPLFTQAIGQLFETYAKLDKQEFRNFIDRLLDSDIIEHRVIAASITCQYYDYIHDPSKLIQRIAQSRYPQVIEKFSQKISLVDSLSKDYRNQVQRIRIRVEDCEIDQQGNLIFLEDNSEFAQIGIDTGFVIRTSRDLANYFLKGVELHEISEALEFTFMTWFTSKVTGKEFLSNFNPIQRFQFVIWLARNPALAVENYDKFNQMATDLSLDLVAFVRSSVAEHLVNHLDSGDPRTFEIVARLCRDHNAEVKITTIEHCVMPLWQFLPSKRDSLLKLAAEMLEHPAVRDRAHGLIGASGTFDYQRDWSDKDISTWVEALATPLLRYGLEHFDHFSRLIGQVWYYYENFHTSNREDISEALDIYTASDFDSLNETAWLIPKIAANSDSTTKEIDHALAIFSRAPVFSKASVEYRLAKDLHLVRHNIFKQLIERPFHIESPEEFVSERAAIILGLLNSDSGNHEIILNIFENQRGILLEEKLVNYVNSQSDLLKMQLVLQAYGYDQASHVGARDAKLFHHKLIVMLVRYFVSQKPVSSYGRLIAAAVMCNEDHHSEEDKERWQSFVRLFLSSEDESFLQDFSLMLFAFNIGSNVHNLEYWFWALAEILEHWNISFRTFVFQRFGEFLHKIFDDLIKIIGGYFSSTSIVKKWSSSAFLHYLVSNSEPFRDIFGAKKLLQEVKAEWEKADAQKKDFLFASLVSAILPDRYPQNQLIANFYEKEKELFNPSQKQLIEAKMYVEQISTSIFDDPGSKKIDVWGRDIYEKRVADLEKAWPKLAD